MKQYICNLIVPGAAKSGTSSLHEALSLHPEICMSTFKEPFFFCIKNEYERGPDFHNSLFEGTAASKIYGESSTGYMIGEEVTQRILECLFNPKIIMVLRDPVERTFSHYRWRYKLGLEKRPFLKAVRENGYGYDPEKPDTYGYMSYLQFSKYSIYIPLLIDAFGKENVLLLSSKMLREDTDKTLAECFRLDRKSVV